jgi:hypothetical protein
MSKGLAYIIPEGGVVEHPCERLGTIWGGQISPSSAPIVFGSSYLEADVLQNLQIKND